MGKLPFAAGQVEGITATYEKSIGVIIDGVHPKFVEATRQSQCDQDSEAADAPDPVATGDPLLEPDHAEETG